MTPPRPLARLRGEQTARNAVAQMVRNGTPAPEPAKAKRPKPVSRRTGSPKPAYWPRPT